MQRKKMSELSDRLRELRGATSQAEMARELDMPRQQWINYERGKNMPGAEIIAKICRAHSCSADWLLGLPTRGGVVAPNNSGAIAIGGSASVTIGESPLCSKCPYKRKLKAIERALK